MSVCVLLTFPCFFFSYPNLLVSFKFFALLDRIHALTSRLLLHLILCPAPPRTPGPRGDGRLPGRGAEPRQHRQVPEQPQDHGPHLQAERQIRSPAAAIETRKRRRERIRGLSN